MATQARARSGTLSGPHSVSLKVLRLSRPSLATQTPLPATDFFSSSSDGDKDGGDLNIPPRAALAYSSAAAEEAEGCASFPLTPLLTLPAAFGAAYVGETFACTLCANNELQGDEARRKSVAAVRITAELQTPSNPAGIGLKLEKAPLHGAEDAEEEDEEDDDDDDGGDDDAAAAAVEESLEPGATMQRTLRHELKDEGPHVLVVTVTYTETLRTSSGGPASAGRSRTFRKLYQFVAQPLLAVRSKVTERRRRAGSADAVGPQWVLEAQLENVGETSVMLEKVWLKEKEGIFSRALHDDGGRGDGDSPDAGGEAAVLKPQDVEQVMFLLRPDPKQPDTAAFGKRIPLGQLHISWRSGMGEKGSLTTGWLASRGS